MKVDVCRCSWSLGESAACAACLSIDAGVAVQDLPYDALNDELLIAQQVIAEM